MLPSELDKQSPVKVHRWIDIGSEEWRMLDDTPDFTKLCLRLGMEDGYLYTDANGRVWGKPKDPSKPHYPFHFEVEDRIYGYRLPKKAAN